MKSKIAPKKAREFLIGISTGDFSNSFLSFTFSRFGLNHLLAISGFHFGLLLFFLNTLLKPFLPKRLKILLLMIGLSGFYFFVGNAPSLSRAWIVALVYLSGELLNKKVIPTNTLSLSMLIILILDPLMLTHLGFQFSFLVTYSILLYYPKISLILIRKLKPSSKIEEGILKSLSLGVSVHIIAIPLTLFYFHKFFLLSFFYNLFVPSFVGLIIFIFLTALVLNPLASLIARPIFYLAGYLSEHMLKVLYWIPTSTDYSIRVPVFPLWCLLIYLISFLYIGSYDLNLDLKEESFYPFNEGERNFI